MKRNSSIFKKPLFLLAIWFLFLIILIASSSFLSRPFVKGIAGFILLSFLITPFITVGLGFWAFFRGIKQVRNKDKLYGIINITLSIIIMIILFFVLEFFISSPFGSGCTRGLECFPSGGFPQDYINCGIINRYYSNDTTFSVKECMLNSKDNCINAYARIDYYGVEGQTGVSKFIVVERNQLGCELKYYTADGETKIGEEVCNIINDSSEDICQGIYYP